ncbi:MAG: hypothetical protein KDK39_12800 [Leptospiraceae bacterium]|nr:hypothetical protein [Leptospiraceae bacterium]
MKSGLVTALRGLVLVSSLSLLGLNACDTAADSADLEAERDLLLWVLYQTGDYNWYPVCTASQTVALNCAGAASASSLYIAALETLWSSSVASPQTGDEICNAANLSHVFNQMTPGARACYFRCQQNYWQSQIDGGNCTALQYSAALSGAATGSSACFTSCLQNDTRFLY